METKGQRCDSAFCPDVGKIDAYNIKIHSYAERRFYCTPCRRTFGADKGTFFETLRTGLWSFFSEDSDKGDYDVS